jgi:hypothetical protein
MTNGTKPKKSDFFEGSGFWDWLKNIEKELEEAEYKKQVLGSFEPEVKMGTAKLITQCGSERQAPADLSKNTIIATITDGCNIVGKRTFQKDKFRDGEYREVYTEYTSDYLKILGKAAQKKEAPVKDHKNVQELVKDLSLQELIDLKLKDMQFIKEESNR